MKPRSGAAVVAPPGSSPHEHPGPGWHQTLILAVFLPPAQAEEAAVATSCSAWAALCSVKRGQSFSGSSPGAHQGLPNSALRPRRPAASPRGFASQGGQDVAGRLERRLLALSQGCTRLLAALSRQGGREDPGSPPKIPPGAGGGAGRAPAAAAPPRGPAPRFLFPFRFCFAPKPPGVKRGSRRARVLCLLLFLAVAFPTQNGDGMAQLGTGAPGEPGLLLPIPCPSSPSWCCG